MKKNIHSDNLEVALLAIEQRLKRWAGLEDADSTLKYEDACIMANCIDIFTKKCGENWLYEEFGEGIFYGLCQIIDLTNDDVLSVLPYLLTAYLCNYPQNKFVQDFIRACNNPPSPLADGAEKEYAEKVVFPSRKELLGLGDMSKYQDQPYAVYGIGQLLTGMTNAKSVRINQQLHLFAQRFRFEKKRISIFQRRSQKIPRSNLRICPDKPRQKSVRAPIQFQRYQQLGLDRDEVATAIDICMQWYSAINTALQDAHNKAGCTVTPCGSNISPYLSLRLLCDDIVTPDALDKVAGLPKLLEILENYNDPDGAQMLDCWVRHKMEELEPV